MLSLNQKNRLAALLKKLGGNGDNLVIDSILKELTKIKASIPLPANLSPLTTDLKSLQASHANLAGTIASLVSQLTELKNQPKDDSTQKALTAFSVQAQQDLDTLSEEVDRLRRRPQGGSMNRKITIGGTDPLTRYTDINFATGTFTTANDNTNKRVNFTLNGAAFDSSYIRLDGTTVTTARIPFTKGWGVTGDTIVGNSITVTPSRSSVNGAPATIYPTLDFVSTALSTFRIVELGGAELDMAYYDASGNNCNGINLNLNGENEYSSGFGGSTDARHVFYLNQAPYFIIDYTGMVGIGTSVVWGSVHPAATVEIYGVTDLTGSTGIYVHAPLSTTVFGLRIDGYYTDGIRFDGEYKTTDASISNLFAFSDGSLWAPSATVLSAWSVGTSPIIYGAGSATYFAGVLSTPNSRSSGATYSGTLSALYHYDAQVSWKSGTATNLAIYHASITATGGTITNMYGLLLPDITAGATINRAIKTGSGQVEFGDNLIWTTDNTKDIGATSATRPRTLYLGTSLKIQATSNQILLGTTNVATLTASPTGARTITFPDLTTTLAGLAVAQTWTGLNNYNNKISLDQTPDASGTFLNIGPKPYDCTTAFYYALYNYNYVNNSGSGGFSNLYSSVDIAGSGTQSGSVYAINGVVQNIQGTAVTGTAYGMNYIMVQGGAGAVTKFVGAQIDGRTLPAGGNMTTYNGFNSTYTLGFGGSSTGNVTTLTHYNVTAAVRNSGTVNTITTEYGLYVPDLTGAFVTNAYPVWLDVAGGIYFRQTTEFINSANAGYLDLHAATGVRSNAKLTTYNNIATAGWGVAAIYGSGRLTAQTGAILSVATYTVGASDGSFYVSANVLVTTATLHNFTVTCTYTDEGGTSRTLTIPFTNLAGTALTGITNAAGAVPYEGIPQHLRCKASSAITIATTGTFTTVTYNVEGIISQIT